MPAQLWTFLLKARLVLTLAAAAALMCGAALVFVGHVDPVPAPNAVVTPAPSPSRSVHDPAVATSTLPAPPTPADASVPVQIVALSRPVEELPTRTTTADGPAKSASITAETPSAVPNDSTTAATPEPTSTDG